MNLHEPERLELVGDDVTVEVGGLTFRTVEAPGHRPGCLLWCVDDPEHGPIIFTGDVLFAGSIGRTDLAGGDMDAMRHTLRTVVPALGDDAILLPGHGPETTLGAERASNPYLQPSFLGK